MRNKIKIIALLQIFLLTAIGCGSRPSGFGQSVKLAFWGTFETSQNMDVLIKAFQQAYPNVSVTFTEKNYQTYESELLNSWANQEGPDIFMIHNDWLPKYQNKAVPAPADLIPVKAFKDTFVDVVQRDFLLHDKIYGIPLSVDSMALYYNKDILGSFGIATPPKTWDELRRQVKAVTKFDPRSGFFLKSGIALGTTSNINIVSDIFYLLMLQAGVTPYLPDYSASTLDLSVRKPSGQVTNPTSDAINFFLSFSDPSSDYYTWNAKSNYSIDAFAKGELAFLYGYWFTNETILKKAPNLNYDIAPVPQPDLNQNVINYANYWASAVSKQSKNHVAAWNFLKFISKKENLKLYYAAHKLPSSRKDIIAEQVNDTQIGVFAASNLNARSAYKKDAIQVDQIIIDMLNDIIHGNISIEKSIGKANQRINLIINQSPGR